MTNRGMAEAYLAQASEVLEEARDLLRRGVWNLVVRRSQEVVELCLKGALRAAGFEVPKIHDVGALLRQRRARFPEEFSSRIDWLASVSERLRSERERAFYGEEESGTTPQELYTNGDAERARADAEQVLTMCRNLVTQMR